MTARGGDDELAAAKLEAFQKGDGVTVSMRLREKGSWFNWHSWNGDARIQVTVPKRYRVTVQTSGGSVKLADTVGAADLHTSGGEIVAKNVNGNIEAQTSGGGISAD